MSVGSADRGHRQRKCERFVALNAEIKRRTDVVVGIFPNEASLTRLVGALLLKQNDEWQLQRRYMSLEALRTLSDDQPARLSAVVN